jgi:hypothetical protein
VEEGAFTFDDDTVGPKPPGVPLRRRKALWSVASAALGFLASAGGLVLSDQFGNPSTIAGIQQNDASGADTFLALGAMDLVLGAIAVFLAVSARRTARTRVAGDGAVGDGEDVALVGLVLGCVVVLGGLVAIGVGLVLRSLNSLTF